MQTREIIERIMTGESVCPSVPKIHSAERIMAWVRDTDSHHTKETCRSSKPKDCVHAPDVHVVEFAAVLASEAANACTCGEHGVDDPAAVQRIGRDFIARWT